MIEKIYGIDLGTTNSCLAVLDKKPRVIPIDGTGIVPSAVSIDGSKILVGRQALNRSVAFPEQSVRSIKRLMGTDQQVQLADKSYKPEEISAIILEYLCKEAKRLEGVDVKRVVITVPAYFSEAQRRATMKAGELAGLKVERIINEPTAAALFYDLVKVADDDKNEKGWRNALVYDLGGGTLDVSVLRMGQIAEVLSSVGDTHLGGDDFDACLTQILLAKIKETDDVDLSDFRPAMARLTAAAEKAKIELSIRGTTTIEETMIPGPDRKNFALSLVVDRQDFEMFTKHLMDKTLTFIDKALKESGLKTQDIDRVILVGGMTRMPIVAEKLRNIFGDAQVPVVDPDLSVAKGAAIQGGIITGENADQVLVDVTAHTLNVRAFQPHNGEHVCVPIIPRNTPIPATLAQVLSTLVPYQEVCLIAVYQGESRDPKENEFIGSSYLKLSSVNTITPIEIEFSYDVNGMIHVIAEQKGYKRKLEIDLDSRNIDNNRDLEDSPDFSRFFSDQDDDDDFDEGDDEVEGDEPSGDSGEYKLNFVLKRANTLLSSLEDGEVKDKLADLTNRYSVALKEDADDIDDLEDSLLAFMEKDING
jgi:molecular chaperone DnaK